MVNMDEMFYGTLPQDTQDFSQVLRGVGRSIKDIGRGVSYYPYDLLGAPVDIINMALQPVGLGSERPVLGSDYLRNIAQSLGYAQPSTGSGAETAGRLGAAFVNPAAGARAVGQAGNLVTRGANLSADKLVQMITGNPQATAPRVLEETSMPFMQAMAPKTPSLLEPTKSDIGFYSQLEAATIPLQNKGTGDQYLAQISKTAGVKPEEIQWTGLDEFLKGKKSVTKDEILSYLNSNRVDVKEVQLGEGLPAGFTVRRNPRGDFDVLDPEGRIAGMGLSRAEAISSAGFEGTATKFSTYTLPGGENYREILLTLPQKNPEFDPVDLGRLTELSNKTRTPAETEEYRALAQRYDASLRGETTPEYRSSHFDQPNILAHMRVNDRVVDGKKTLFIEEIQSDWHQAGRKKGYAGEASKNAEAEFKQYSQELANKYNLNPDENLYMYADMKGMQPEETAKYVLLQSAWVESKGGVPDAPFKTTWHELSLKRAIQEASEKGYDQIAFTTGKTQAERYDLSKQISRVVYNEPGSKRANKFGTVLYAYDKNGDQVIGKSVAPEELADYIGKEAADKLMKAEADSWGQKELAGVDLQVGGEGMKGFYDNILPKSLDKLAKKFDAKVGKTEMDGVEVWQMDITPKMRESVTTKGQPLFAVPAVGAGLLGASMMQDEEMF
jgi:hypothetical protein